MTTLTLAGIGIVEGIAEGAALVSPVELAFSLVDARTGIIKHPGHPLLGQPIAGRVLVFPSGSGSSSGSYWMLNLADEGNAPAAIINVQANAVVTAGAVLAGIPMVHRVAPDPIRSIKTGQHVRVDGASGIVQVFPAGENQP